MLPFPALGTIRALPEGQGSDCLPFRSIPAVDETEISAIGFVGAGGIGQELMFVIRQFVYTDISAIVLMIIATVSLIDMSCEKLRHQFIAERKVTS
jgi:hypothetical protein